MKAIWFLGLMLVCAVSITGDILAQEPLPQGPPAPQLTEEKLFAQLGRLNAQLQIQAEYIQTLAAENTRLKTENKKLTDELAKVKGTDAKKSGGL